MSEVLEPDLCVIGAGAAGLSAAAIAASFGVQVVLIEKDAAGESRGEGADVARNALIAAGARRHAVRGASRFGIGRGRSDPVVDFARVRDHARGAAKTLAPNDALERYVAMGVRVVRGAARFTDLRTVEAAGLTIRARRFIVATGSRAQMPPIPGLAGLPCLTHETIANLAEKPTRLIVIGAGAREVEIAQAHRRLGTDVTLVAASSRILPEEDPEMAGVIGRALAADGAGLTTGVAIERVEGAGEGVMVVLRRGEETQTVSGSHILAPSEYRAAVEGLGLEAAGITLDDAGIRVDNGLRTTNPKVYAIGGCAGGAAAGNRHAHVANYHAGLVIRNALFRVPVKVGAMPIPRVVNTDPELAVVGLSEAEARARSLAFRILRWPVAENPRAVAERRTQGHAKAIVTPRGRILGCAIAAPRAGELIAPWALAMAKNLKVQDLANLVLPSATFSEVTRRTAVEYLRPAAQSPWLRRAAALVRRFG